MNGGQRSAMSVFGRVRQARIPRLNAVRPSRSYASTSPSLPGSTAPLIVGAAAALAVGYYAGTRSLRADSAASKIEHHAKASDEKAGQYASKAEIAKVIKLLQGRLRDDQVTTNQDDLLGHGQSPNTYHGEPSSERAFADKQLLPCLM